MNPEEQAWRKLVEAARRARAERDERDTAAPYGFATRVAALAMAERRPRATALMERFSWRALGVAALLAVASVAASYALPSTTTSATADDEALPDPSTVTAVFDLS